MRQLRDFVAVFFHVFLEVFCRVLQGSALYSNNLIKCTYLMDDISFGVCTASAIHQMYAWGLAPARGRVGRQLKHFHFKKALGAARADACREVRSAMSLRCSMTERAVWSKEAEKKKRPEESRALIINLFGQR